VSAPGAAPTRAGVITAQSVAVGYQGRPVVGGLSFTLDPGEALALVGTNGSGKSTLLKTLVGLLAPLGGSLDVLGRPPGGSPRRVAYLSQFHAAGFVLPLRVRDVVRMGRYANHGLLGRLGEDDERLIDESLERMGISALADRSLRDLSGGQQQRTYLAQVLARRADLLVLDEPTAGVDAAGQGVYGQALEAERARGAAVVVATHDIGEAAQASQVLLLAGRVVAQGAPTSVLTADNLLDTFGIGLRRLGDDYLLAAEAHGHQHPEPPGFEAHGHHDPAGHEGHGHAH